MQVANVTTPAHYSHLLRRQMYGGHDRRGLCKPLVLFTPKSLLRHPKVVFCSGKVYYDLLAEREKRGLENQVAIMRLEQIYPFPAEEIENALWRYPSTAEIVWAQEEPRNMGAYLFVKDRPESASTAAGGAKRHAQEQAAVLEDAFSGGSPTRPRKYRVVPKKRKTAELEAPKA